MSGFKRPLMAAATLAVTGCAAAGGLNFWLYPQPHLAAPEEAVFVTDEQQQVQSIDGEETAARCWGRVSEQQAYRRKDLLCRLHIRPGEHSVVFRPNANRTSAAEVRFTALPGRAYGLDRSKCSSSPGGSAQSCQVDVVEIGRLQEAVRPPQA